MKYYIVDAFANHMFEGNPAGVCMLDKPLDEKTMQNIAMENNLPETAFMVKAGEAYNLRWFTPEMEIDLCGHATLASAFILLNYYEQEKDTITFNTMSGQLRVVKKGELYEMDFPSRAPEIIEVSKLMERATGARVLEAHQSRDLLFLLENEEAVRTLKPDFELMKQIQDCFAVIVTAKGDEVDFVSRFFAPGAGIAEDPVTGSAHSTLIPFWAGRLNKNRLVAKQLSKRSGTLYCENAGERVKIAGRAMLYLKGDIMV